MLTELLVDPEEAKEQGNPLTHYGIADSEWEYDESDTSSTEDGLSDSYYENFNSDNDDEGEDDSDDMNISSPSLSSQNGKAMAEEEEAVGISSSHTNQKIPLTDAFEEAESHCRLVAEHAFRLQEEPTYRLRYETEEEEHARRLREERQFRSQWEPRCRSCMQY